MSVPERKTQHPFALFFLNLFHTGSVPARVEAAKRKRITLADLAKMPKETQMLLAYCLKKNNPDLTLLDDDTDACKLVSGDWLISVPCTTIGIMCFRIKPDVWRRLRSLRSVFLAHDLMSDLEAYRKRKSALYPWIW